MFTEVTLRNYRSHQETTIQLKRVSLFIGDNNTGKSNFLVGIEHFSGLVRRGAQAEPSQMSVVASDLFPHRYKLALDDEGMGIRVVWRGPTGGKIIYEMELTVDHRLPEQVGCREKIIIATTQRTSKQITSGYDSPTNLIALRSKIAPQLGQSEQELCGRFFSDFGSVCRYNLHSSFLKGIFQTARNEETNGHLQKPWTLGSEGRNLQEMILETKERDEEAYFDFVRRLQRLEHTFRGVRRNAEGQAEWVFEPPARKKADRQLYEFPPRVLSDGLMKAAAIALMASLRERPALILLEEIESGMNRGDLELMITWIWQTTSPNEAGYASQFIMTSHSITVLREFNEHLRHVYTFRLDKLRFKSNTRNLHTELKKLFYIGSVDGEIYENDEGCDSLIIPKYKLADMWFSGAVG